MDQIELDRVELERKELQDRVAGSMSKVFKRIDFFANASMVVALLATTYTGFLTFSKPGFTVFSRNVFTAKIADLEGRHEIFIKESNARITHLEKVIEARSAALPRDSALAEKQAQLTATQGELDRRMRALEDSLLATPATSLGLPLLRKDLDILRERIQTNDLANREREVRTTDTMKWIFGLVAAAITGIVAQWYGNRFKQASEKAKAEQSKATTT